nr:hypothetical protein [Ensifer adhaerens]
MSETLAALTTIRTAEDMVVAFHEEEAVSAISGKHGVAGRENHKGAKHCAR